MTNRPFAFAVVCAEVVGAILVGSPIGVRAGDRLYVGEGAEDT